jgi:hypothetical protein
MRSSLFVDEIQPSVNDLAKSEWDLAKCGWDLAECRWDLAELWMRCIAECGRDLAELMMRCSRMWMRSSRLWMVGSRVAEGIYTGLVRVPDCQSRNSLWFDCSIFRHSEIWGAAYKAVSNQVLRRKIDIYKNMPPPHTHTYTKSHQIFRYLVPKIHKRIREKYVWW